MAIEIKNTSGIVIYTVDGDSLTGADLRGANLRGADLACANLSGADLRWANLSGANLREADLSGADLSDADLKDANLTDADLTDANLSHANLSHANLRHANLTGADVFSASASAVTSNYNIFATSNHLMIGCQFHSWVDWIDFDDAAINKMDGKRALKFWRCWKPILVAIATDRGWI